MNIKVRFLNMYEHIIDETICDESYLHSIKASLPKKISGHSLTSNQSDLAVGITWDKDNKPAGTWWYHPNKNPRA